MKLSTRLFILFEILDLALTFFAIRWGLGFEVNPIGFTVFLILLKGVSVLFVAYVIEHVDFGWLVWILVVGMYLVVWWNMIVIFIELVNRLEAI